MADTKVTALVELDPVAVTDLVMVVDDPGGTPISKKATVDNLYLATQAYGNILVTGGAAAQGLTAATPEKLTLFAADGPSLNTTPAHADDQITVDVDGVYHIEAQFSMTTSGTSVIFPVLCRCWWCISEYRLPSKGWNGNRCWLCVINGSFVIVCN